MLRLKLGIAFALCLVGCAASDKSVLTNPVYQGASLAGRSLLLLPLVDVKIEDLGGFDTASTFKFMMEKSDWKKVVSDAVVTIVKNTPLKGKKFQERLNNKEQFKGNHALGYH